MIAGLIAISFLGVLCLGIAGFCVWKMGEVMDKMQEAAKREQDVRLAEREAAFRREKFLITVLLTNNPQLADTLSKMPAAEKEQPENFTMSLPGFGEAEGTRRVV